CALSYHHIDQVQEITNNLVEYLVAGTGVLLVVDLIRTEHTIARHIVKKHISHVGGFEENEIREMYEKAGLKDFSWIFVGNWEWEGTPISMFMAKGTRPADS
ncbi:hypothetical protein FRC02_010894, partial [Tulasnella sp. 418]